VDEGYDLSAAASELLWMPSVQGGRYLPDRHLIVTGKTDYGVRDIHGRTYLDLNSGLWHISFGYNHPVLMSAAHKAVEQIPATSMFRRVHEPALSVAVRLAERLPEHRFFFGCSGSDAGDTAMRMASAYRRAKGREGDLFATVRGGYHGVTYAAMSVMGIESYRGAGATSIPHVVLPRVEEDADAEWSAGLDRTFAATGNSLTAVFVEVIQGSGGIIPLSCDYLRALRKKCDDYDVPLVVDEVATGVHRTGPFLASSDVGIRGDMTIMSKALTGGFGALSVVAAHNRVFETINAEPAQSRVAGFTQGGHPAACQIAAAVLDYTETPEFLSLVSDGGRFLADQVPALAGHPIVDRVTGRGHMWGVQLHPGHLERLGGADGFVEKATRAGLHHGVLLHPLASGTIPFMPPIVAPEPVLADMAGQLGRVLDALGAA
jgi:adenosylmethionine-8-amino-7-oxononanoate aminotransferase